jgi:hypothetical protein
MMWIASQQKQASAMFPEQSRLSRRCGASARAEDSDTYHGGVSDSESLSDK